MTCTDFNNCKKEMLDRLEQPTDENSLYADRIYDNETATRRCYETKNPVARVLEGFGLTGGSKSCMETISKWLSIFLVVCLIIWCLSAIFSPNEEIHLGVESISEFDPATIFKNLQTEASELRAQAVQQYQSLTK